VLRDGLRTRVSGFESTDGGVAVTCVVATGDGKGKGFRIGLGGVIEVGPAP
jgi:hypothetical protein